MKIRLNGGLQTSWQRLQPREQYLILAGVVLVIVTAVWMLFSNVLDRRQVLMSERNLLLEELAFMQEQVGILARLGNACTDTRIDAGSARQLLQALALRNRVKAGNISEEGSGRFTLQLEGADGNAFLRFAHHSACQGFDIVSIAVNPPEDSTEGNELLARMELRREP